MCHSACLLSGSLSGLNGEFTAVKMQDVVRMRPLACTQRSIHAYASRDKGASRGAD
jgi:hypothetical protein